MSRKVSVAVVAFVFLYIASPLLLPVTMGAVIAVLFSPWLTQLESRKIPPRIGAMLLTSGITLVLILPAAFLLFLATKTCFSELQHVSKNSNSEITLFDHFFNMPKVHPFFVWVTDWAPISINDLANTVRELGGSIGSKIAESLGEVLKQLPGVAITLIVMVLSIYFFLVDRKPLIKAMRYNSIFSLSESDQMIRAVAETCRSVLLAALISGFIQAVIEMVACIFSGRENVIMVGLFVFVGSFIPVIGAAPITFGLALQYWILGQNTLAITFLGVAAFIMAVDNAIRPLFLKGTARLHPMLAFVSALGGLETLGFTGIFLGPILATLFMTTLRVMHVTR